MLSYKLIQNNSDNNGMISESDIITTKCETKDELFNLVNGKFGDYQQEATTLNKDDENIPIGWIFWDDHWDTDDNKYMIETVILAHTECQHGDPKELFYDRGNERTLLGIKYLELV